MDFFRIQFSDAPADEGEEWEYKTYRECDLCGLKYLPFSHLFLVPDDTVERIQLRFCDDVYPSLLEVAGLLFCRDDIVSRFGNSRLRGFSFDSDVGVESGDIEGAVPPYQWMRIEGRCETEPVWEEVISVCSKCQSATMRPVNRPDRSVRLTRVISKDCSIFRARERAVGIVVNDQFRQFLLGVIPGITEVLQFEPI